MKAAEVLEAIKTRAPKAEIEQTFLSDFNAKVHYAVCEGQKVNLWDTKVVLGSMCVNADFSKASVDNMIELFNSVSEGCVVESDFDDESVMLQIWGHLISLNPSNISDMSVSNKTFTEEELKNYNDGEIDFVTRAK